MVFREGTVIQIRTVMDEMEKSLNLHEVKKSITDTSTYRKPDRLSNRGNVKPEDEVLMDDGPRCCMGNHLFKSVFKCRFKKVRLLMDKGFNVNTKNDYGYNVLVAALHIESDVHRAKMFKLLLDKGANPLDKDRKHGRSVLSWASLLGRHDEVLMILQILKGELDLHDKDNDGMTALHHATQGGHVPVVRTLIQEFRVFRLTVDVPDKLGLSPYLHARRLGFTEIANILRDEGKACPAQSDLYTFRTSKEWSDIGNKEREDKETRRRMSSYNLAAIFGRSRLIQSFQNPQNPLPSNSNSQSAPQTTVSYNQAAQKDGDDKSAQAVQTSSTRSGPSIMRYGPRSISEPPYSNSYRNKNYLSVPVQKSVMPTLSLFDMATNGRQVQDFKHSELDTSKIPQGKHQTSITAMMEALSEQQCGSFRPTVKVKTPETFYLPSHKKRSTLAILFGKNKKGKTKRGSANCSGKRPRGILKNK